MNSSEKNPQVKSNANWFQLYYFMAAVSLIVVGFSLVVNHGIMNIYTKSNKISEKWSDRQARYIALSDLATKVIAPGNDVFESRDVVKESIRFKALVRKLYKDIAASKNEIVKNVTQLLAKKMLASLAEAETNLQDLEYKAISILGLMKADRIVLAGRHMAAMNRHYSQLSLSLSTLGALVRVVKSKHLEKQVKAAIQLKNYEYAIAFAMLLVMVMVIIYGKKMSRTMREMDKIKQGYVDTIKQKDKYNSLILSNATEGIMTINSSGEILSANPALEQLFGYSVSELIGQNVKMLMPDDVATSHDSYLKNANARMEFQRLAENRELIGEHKDKSWFPIEIDIVSIDYEGQTIFLGQIHDISKQKETEEILINAKAAAEKTLKMKSQFLATMSHEIRTPMNGILGMAELITDTSLDAEQTSYVNTISSSGKSLLNIINDILDYSKLESGLYDFESKNFDLYKSIKEACTLLETKATEKNITIKIKYDKACAPYYVGDSHRINQIIINLMGNAIKFSHDNTVQINVLNKRKFDNKAEIKIEIIDKGIGLKPESIVDLFQAFTQADSSTTRNYGGTGLGLSISKQLAEAMGGSIGVDSVYGEGSTFWFTIQLPTSTGESEEGGKQNSTEDEELLNIIQDIKGRVLLAEDNSVNQKIALFMLKDLNIEIDLATNGEEALSMYLEKEYDLILMDCQMPVVDGYDATKAIRELEQAGKSVSIVALTANALVGDDKKCFEAGMNDYLSKPFKQKQLILKVVKWLSHSNRKAG